jgi:hypothetical protein
MSEEVEMNYDQFLAEVKAGIQEKLGSKYEISLQKVTKNNGIVLDGLIIGKAERNLAPTIYLNSYFMHFTQGMSLPEILEDIIAAYKENMDIAPGDMRGLLDFNNLKNKIVYKLIQKEKNQVLLNDLPFFEFLDLAMVFYLILDENKEGQMTAMIHNSHMQMWGVTKEAIYELAKENNEALLPPKIKTMKAIMHDMLKELSDEMCVDEVIEDFFDIDSKGPSMYVLSNKRKMNGAGCILYDNCLKEFAILQGSDIIILPSSVNEVILVPDKGKLDYEELQNIVGQINESEVPEEDVLSNHIYKYSFHDSRINIIK